MYTTIRNYTMMLLFVCITLHAQQAESPNLQNDAPQKKVPKIITSLITGCSTGIASHYLYKKYIKQLPFSWWIKWWISGALRSAAINGTHIIFDEYTITHNDTLMHSSSFITTWMLYLIENVATTE